ncbi:MAG: pantoate--beta-alanine ligase [Kiritimatiellaeota bacterium]|nr:pantoate--beta-alanine ligase [Kiritimatiellota bacterium]
MRIVRTISEMQALSRRWRGAGDPIGFVPTMGYLHEGHLSLVRIARRRASAVVVSIFVNPTQFGPNEDFDSYPRDFERDEALCRREGVRAVFYPDAEEMYPPDYSTWVTEEQLSGPLCGRSRPGHFRGVCTVVTKLFLAVCPDVAVFGQKDAQQALVIQRMVRDLNFPLQVVIGPIVREADGLAMSSRNKHLEAAERRAATAVFKGLQAALEAFRSGERRTDSLVQLVRAPIKASGGRIDYVELVSRERLEPMSPEVTAPALLAAAVFYGKTRLIDNVFLG